MALNYSIYTGAIWRDHSTNKLILTLKDPAAGVLQATIPLWIALVGPWTWIIIQYFWYRYLVARGPRSPNPFYLRQQQVLLRNSAGDLRTVWDSIQLFRVWKRYGILKSLRKTIGLMSTSFVFWCLWQLLAVYPATFIWTQAPNVGLLRDGVCGYNFIQGPSPELTFRQSGLLETIQAETYAAQCYGSGSSGACNVYKQQDLSYQSSNGTCPFQSDDICISQGSDPYKLTTGPIDSHTDLGINAPPSDRVTYQKTVTCSPIHSTKFARIVNANETYEDYYWPPNTRLQQFYYGPIQDSNFSYTFEYSEWTPLDNIPYDIQGVMYNPGPPGTVNAWAINQTFTNRTDGDTSILFLTPNTISNMFPSKDPFFLTGDSYNVTIGGKTMLLYAPAYSVNVMGCFEQHRICNPTTPDLCTPYTAYLNFGDPNFLATLDLNPIQLATAHRIVAGLDMTLTFNSVSNRRGAALLASQTVSDVLQTRQLPDDQWRNEAENWFVVSLAKLQLSILEFSAGPLDPDVAQYVQFPLDAETANMCYNQLVQLPSGYQNFDFDAIIIVICLGLFFGFIGFGFEWLAGLFIRKWGNSRGLSEWARDGQFQQLKQIYELKQVTDWEHSDDEFPITLSNV